jgi:hypothetical protein
VSGLKLRVKPRGELAGVVVKEPQPNGPVERRANEKPLWLGSVEGRGLAITQARNCI